jgi:prepilin-type N-terminal cleavage/methylation domain-containing protein
MRGRTNGFTLIELMLVVTIIILMAGAAVPLLSNMAGAGRVDNAASQVQAIILMARQQAVQYHVETSVEFIVPDLAHPYTRVITGQCGVPGTGNTTGFSVVAGSYAIKMPNGIQVANGAGATTFSIAFTTAGMVHPQTLAADLVLDIGPITGTESAEQTVEYRLNRVTGAFLQLTDREITK